MEATWTESRADLVAALMLAQENPQLDLEPLRWQRPVGSRSFTVQPDHVAALRLFPAGKPDAVCDGVVRGESLPQLQAQGTDDHGNTADVDWDEPSTACTMLASISLHPDHDESDLQPPRLALRDEDTHQLEFEASWNEETSTLCLSDKASLLADQQLGNSEVVTAVYEVEVISKGPLQGLKGAFSFSYSDRLSQKQEQEEAKRILEALTPKDRKCQKVRSFLSSLLNAMFMSRHQQRASCKNSPPNILYEGNVSCKRPTSDFAAPG